MSASARSQLFTAYNHARQAARMGLLDAGRLNRALGIAQASISRCDAYRKADGSCGCPDCTYRPWLAGQCKHNLARMLLTLGAPAAAARDVSDPFAGLVD